VRDESKYAFSGKVKWWSEVADLVLVPWLSARRMESAAAISGSRWSEELPVAAATATMVMEREEKIRVRVSCER